LSHFCKAFFAFFFSFEVSFLSSLPRSSAARLRLIPLLLAVAMVAQI
jgi:hypothetical protein